MLSAFGRSMLDQLRYWIGTNSKAFTTGPIARSVIPFKYKGYAVDEASGTTKNYGLGYRAPTDTTSVLLQVLTE